MVSNISRKDYILGSLKIKAEDVEASELLEIVETCLARCGPYFKYFPDFVPIKDKMNGYQGPSSDAREADISKAELFEGFNGETPCIYIMELSSSTEGKFIDVSFGECLFITSEELLLTRKGQLVIWESKYERELRRDNRLRGYVVAKAVFSRVTEVRKDKLLELLIKHKRLGAEIVELLVNLTYKTYNRRKRNLIDFEELRKDISAIGSKFS